MTKTLRIVAVSSALLLTATFSTMTYAWGLSSTGQQIGNFYYENFNNGVTCTTQIIGQFTYTNCF